MMEAACTSETSVDNYFTRQYIPEDNFELQLQADLSLTNTKKDKASTLSGKFSLVFVHCRNSITILIALITLL
jgi:hypothetical protein